MSKKPVFQHRHYKAIAALIDEMSREGFPATTSHISGRLADMLEADNPRFDRARFMAACSGKPTNSRDRG
jgi:hypothetical protein